MDITATSKKRKGLWVNLAVYLGAFGISLIPFLLTENLILAEFVFTVTATVIVYIVSCVIKDTSLYDPYWSVAPPVMLFLAMYKGNFWYRNGVVLLCAVMVWAVRLTKNWINTYKGLRHEDWRYAGYRKKLNKGLFELLNFFGFMMMPTLVTFAGMVGAFYVIQDERNHTVIQIGVVIMIIGVLLEHFADKSLHAFLAANPGTGLTCKEGIWSYSRHPNYLGEMMFWTGIFVSHFAVYPDNWQRGAGFILIVCVFVFASIPLMEAHNLERREDYAEYMEETSVLFLLPHKTSSKEKLE